MEIFGSFDDSVFQESRHKKSVSLPSYNAKFCEPEWFCESSTADDELEKQKILKFRAELAYSRKDYETALSDYSSCLAVVPEGNLTIRRDVLEGQARCYCYLGRREQAQEIVAKLRKEATNTCHLTCVLNLELAVHHHFGELGEEISVLHHLVSLHPYNPWEWKRLAEGYLRLLKSLLAASRPRVHEESKDHAACSSLPDVNDQNSQKRLGKYLAERERCTQKNHTVPHGVAHLSTGTLGQPEEDCESLWLKAGMCFVRTRLLLRMMRLQQSSFVLKRSDGAVLEAEEALAWLELPEDTLQLITEEMEKDLVSEKMREDNQDGESLAGLSISDFEQKWYNGVKPKVLLTDVTSRFRAANLKI